MSAIFGLIHRAVNPEASGRVERMAEILRHSPAVHAATRRFDDLPLAIGWTTLPYSDCRDQPFWNPSHDICLILAGRLPDFASLSDHAPGRSTRSAQAILEHYQSLGPDFLRDLSGVFAGVIVDLRTRRVHLFNDRYGLGRIYVHETSDALWFASRAKALLGVVPSLRSLDLTGLAESVACGCPLRNRTLFRGLELLPPSSVWTFDASGSGTRSTYFRPSEWTHLEELPIETLSDRLATTLRGALHRCLQGPQPVGLSLTGGLDCRMILALLGRQAESMPAYTFVGPYRECADARLARRLAAECRLQHRLVPVESDFFDAFPALAEDTVYLSDGAMDVSGAVELFVNRLAAEVAPTRLTGNYGSEILRSNVAFRPSRPTPDVFEPSLFGRFEEASRTYSEEARDDRLSFILFKQMPWHHYARLSIEESQLITRTPFLDPAVADLMFRIPAALRLSAEPTLRLIRNLSPALAAIPTDRGLVAGPPRWFHRILRLWQEFTVRCEYAYDYGMPGWVARTDRLFRPLHLERLFLGRHKFYHFRVWYRDRFASFLREILLDPRTLGRGLFLPGAIEKVVGEHVAGIANHTTTLHRLLTIEFLHRRFIDPS